MSSIRKMKVYLTVMIVALALLPVAVEAASHEEGGTAAEIKALIMSDNEFTRKNLRDREGGTSKEGSLEFWSSGGLLQSVPPDAPISEYEAFAISPKHIKVIELPGGQAAVAVFYSEGSFQVKGGPATGHYMTRALQVFVKEDGKWVVRAAHWSPIAAGSGTTQTALD